MKALIVVDMQEVYIGKHSKYKYDNKIELINNINDRINSYADKKQLIIYVKNKRKETTPELATDLLIASNFIFTKEQANSFPSEDFKQCLIDHQIKQVEIVGIDGNCCVKSTAIAAVNYGYEVTIPIICIGIKNQERFQKNKEILIQKGIHLID